MSFDRWLLAAQPATQRNHLLKTQPAPAIAASPHCCKSKLRNCPAPRVSSPLHRLHRLHLKRTKLANECTLCLRDRRKKPVVVPTKPRFPKRTDIVEHETCFAPSLQYRVNTERFCSYSNAGKRARPQRAPLFTECRKVVRLPSRRERGIAAITREGVCVSDSFTRSSSLSSFMSFMYVAFTPLVLSCPPQSRSWCTLSLNHCSCSARWRPGSRSLQSSCPPAVVPAAGEIRKMLLAM